MGATNSAEESRHPHHSSKSTTSNDYHKTTRAPPPNSRSNDQDLGDINARSRTLGRVCDSRKGSISDDDDDTSDVESSVWSYSVHSGDSCSQCSCSGCDEEATPRPPRRRVDSTPQQYNVEQMEERRGSQQNNVEQLEERRGSGSRAGLYLKEGTFIRPECSSPSTRRRPRTLDGTTVSRRLSSSDGGHLPLPPPISLPRNSSGRLDDSSGMSFRREARRSVSHSHYSPEPESTRVHSPFHPPSPPPAPPGSALPTYPTKRVRVTEKRTSPDGWDLKSQQLQQFRGSSSSSSYGESRGSVDRYRFSHGGNVLFKRQLSSSTITLPPHHTQSRQHDPYRNLYSRPPPRQLYAGVCV